MNNDKLILENQQAMMESILYPFKIDSLKTQLKKTEEALNPKEDVPYEDSLEVCECGHEDFQHEDGKYECKLVGYKPKCECKKFVKSSINEKENQNG